ncbi:hypothetical protein Poli38472_009888 [Pythium oligandrum]|uniref:Uncharacterized protein n=1 Tax=Pythium oligandrum TaxID=41045 RepID=A0A8K1CFR9_PYTOL|nr:hypothetical protein Poli38472_009888 [Pythium oligandrum]|eukprot:TMW62395.1 hypothetical protein Poli38472_009888 [Pythium oligandrum]
MPFLPECHDVFERSESTWLCVRSINFGGACLATLVVSVYACHQILPILMSTGWYSTNVVMLVLTCMQMALLVYECFIQNSARTLVVTKCCRGIQVAFSCLLYGKLACDMMNRSRLYSHLLVPVVTVTIVLMASDAFMVVTATDEIDCHHLSWLLSSMAGLILSTSFALPGRIVLDEMKAASVMQQKYLASVSSTVRELEQSYRQLWTLVGCNLISTMCQLLVDIYVTFGVSGTKTCNSMFFEDGSGAFEQLLRLFISILGYLLPNWATIYVFYILPRFQFSTSLEIPDLGQDDSYELLLAGHREDDDAVAT